MSEIDRVTVADAPGMVVLGVRSMGDDGIVVVLTQYEAAHLADELRRAAYASRSEVVPKNLCVLCGVREYVPRPMDPLWAYCDICAHVAPK